MSSIFPSETVTLSNLIQTTVDSSAALPLAKEYAWDYESNDFLLVDGKNVFVTGAAAIKVWIWKALQTPKNRYKAYSGSFGNDMETLVGQGLSSAALSSEIERRLKETILINAYIIGISKISVSIDGSKASVSFTATTIYGDVSMSV